MADFYIKQNDTAPALDATLTDSDDNAVDISGATVNFHMREQGSSTTKVSASATVVSAANGQVRYSWATGDTDTAGTYNAEWEVTYSSGTIETFPSKGYTEIQIDSEID